MYKDKRLFLPTIYHMSQPISKRQSLNANNAFLNTKIRRSIITSKAIIYIFSCEESGFNIPDYKMHIYFWPFTFAINGIHLICGIVCCIVPKPRVCVCDLFHKLFLFSKHTAARSIDGLSMAGTVLSLRRQPAATYYSSDGVVSRNRRWHVNIYVNVCVGYTHRNAGTRQWSWRRRGIHCIWHKRGAN